MAHREHARWLVRLADMFLQAGSWTSALGLLNLLPRSYLRLLPDDCANDPALAERAYRVTEWLAKHAEIKAQVDGETPQVYLVPGQA